MLDAVTTSAVALGAMNVKHIELADEVSKDNCAAEGPQAASLVATKLVWRGTPPHALASLTTN
jgi:hypothetical protein